MVGAWDPTTELERQMRDALRRNDQETYFRLLTGIELFIPLPPETPDNVPASTTPPRWPTNTTAGRTHLLVYTSPEAMRACLGPRFKYFTKLKIADVADRWPDPQWWLAVNAGLPIEGYLPAWFVRQVADGDPRPPAAGQPAPPGETTGQAASPGTSQRDLPGEPAARFTGEFEIEQELLDAAVRGDDEAFVKTLLATKVLLPVPQDAPEDISPDDPGFPWNTAEVRGQTSVLMFTSPELLTEAIGTNRFVTVEFPEVIRAWPRTEWALAVNAGTRVEASVSGDQVRAIREWPAEQATEQASGHAMCQPEPARAEPDVEPTIMQKILPHGHVRWYLDQGYDRVGGYVHRAGDLADLITPGQLYEALGLLYQGSPFSPDDEAVYVIRWAAYRSGLYRTPFGGTSETALQVWGTAGWVVEKPPFEGTGFAPGSGGTILEYKINSLRLPYGSEIYVIGRDRPERLIAMYDTDRAAWMRTENTR